MGLPLILVIDFDVILMVLKKKYCGHVHVGILLQGERSDPNAFLDPHQPSLIHLPEWVKHQRWWPISMLGET